MICCNGIVIEHAIDNSIDKKKGLNKYKNRFSVGLM